ncbi:hypothetical protein IMZ38_01320 [Thermosphaera chiliense]|uniref:Uncharacterized protein n=1 Tax=Thermosphaera chiliense TaxID=3402707 RepID=A0A7M1USR8_9CREN|nr:hypothetical protein [Thermosphaera aggregans]QOR94607.1 hypothetical protein IMZ38_01320 [Thermosphaera aggregans]
MQTPADSDTVFSVEPGGECLLIRFNKLVVKLFAYKCVKQHEDFEKELGLRGLTPDKPAAILPLSMFKTPLQLVQAGIHYELYRSELSRFRNQGLLLLLLATGHSQISSLLSDLRARYSESSHYLLFSIGGEGFDKTGCEVFKDYVQNIDEESRAVLVKNISSLLSLI